MDHHKKYKHLKCLAAMVLLHLILLMLYPLYIFYYLHSNPNLLELFVGLFIVCTAGLGIFVVLFFVICYLLAKYTIAYLLFLLASCLVIYGIAYFSPRLFKQLLKTLFFVLTGLCIYYLCVLVYLVFIKTNVAAFPKTF